MRFRKSARIESGLRQIDIAPLIDCIFILLIFFMLTSSFMVIPGINVKLPKAFTSEGLDARSLTIVISSEDIMYLESKPYTIKEIENFIKKGSYSSIFIRADRDASLGTWIGIYDACRKLGVERISIATTNDEL